MIQVFRVSDHIYSMKFKELHQWNLSPKEAIALQNSLRQKIILIDSLRSIDTIAGADIAFTKDDNVGYAGVIIYKYPELVEIERVSATGKLEFPYVPGLLSFREAPLLLKAFAQLKILPDVIMFDGQGIAHPRRIGIAAHLGLWLNLPTIGCAKSRLTGEFDEPKRAAGSFTELTDKGDLIGAVIRTRTNVKPIFVSPGHLISLKSTIDITLKCTDGLRIPKPTRQADKYVGMLKKSIFH